MMARVRKVRDESRARLDAIAKVASSFSTLKPAYESMTHVRAVPSCFIGFDHATRVGGFPVERFCLAHGPSNHGKTTVVIGMHKSFAALDHMSLFIDAERTTPRDWVETMLGPQLFRHPGFLYRRPETYERTIAEVREFCLTIAEAKDKGKLPEDTSALITVDSIRKLVPAAIMKQIEAENEKGQDADPSRRAAQIKAAMNANWLDELVPLLERAGAGMLIIARETEDPDAPAFAKKFGTNYKVGGGSALVYDASLRLRVERAGWVTKEARSDGPPTVYGERIRITIAKTKIGGKDDKVARCYFHTSNGVWLPEGFDPARDVLELGEKFGVITKSGAWYSHDGERIGQGEHNAVKFLAERYDRRRAIEEQVRASFAKHEPVEEEAA